MFRSSSAWISLAVAVWLGACASEVPLGGLPDAGPAVTDAGGAAPDTGPGLGDAGPPPPELPLSPVPSLSAELTFGEPAGTNVATGWRPRLARSGETVLAVWWEQHGEGVVLKAIRLDTRGVPLERAPRVLVVEDRRALPSPPVAAGADGRFFIAWGEQSGSSQLLRAMVIRASDGTTSWGPEILSTADLSLTSLSAAGAGSDFLVAGVGGVSGDRVFVVRVQPLDRYRHQSRLAHRRPLGSSTALLTTALLADGESALLAWDERDDTTRTRVVARRFSLDWTRTSTSFVDGTNETIVERDGWTVSLAGVARGGAGDHVLVRTYGADAALYAHRFAGEWEPPLMLMDSLSPYHRIAAGASPGGDAGVIVYGRGEAPIARVASLSLSAPSPVADVRDLEDAREPWDLLAFDDHLLVATTEPLAVSAIDLATGTALIEVLPTTTVPQVEPRALATTAGAFVTWEERGETIAHRATFIAPDGRLLFEQPFTLGESTPLAIASDGRDVLVAWSHEASEGAVTVRTCLVSAASGPGPVRESEPLPVTGRTSALVLVWDREAYQGLVPGRIGDHFQHHRLRWTGAGETIGEPGSLTVRSATVAWLTPAQPWLVWADQSYHRPIGDGSWEHRYVVQAEGLGEGGSRRLLDWIGPHGDAPGSLTAAGGPTSALVAWSFEGEERRLDLRYLVVVGEGAMPFVRGGGTITRIGSQSGPSIAADRRSFLLAWESTGSSVEMARLDAGGERVAAAGSEGIHLVQDGATDPSVAALGPGRFLVAYTRAVLGLGTQVRARIVDYPLDPPIFE